MNLTGRNSALLVTGSLCDSSLTTRGTQGAVQSRMGKAYTTTQSMAGWCGSDLEPSRYLSPEPLLQSSTYARLMAQSGMRVPAYAYAANNPISYVDPSGLAIMGPLTPAAFEALRIARLTEEGARIVSALEAAPQLFSVEAASLKSGTFGTAIPTFDAAGRLSSARMLLDFRRLSRICGRIGHEVRGVFRENDRGLLQSRGRS